MLPNSSPLIRQPSIKSRPSDLYWENTISIKEPIPKLHWFYRFFLCGVRL